LKLSLGCRHYAAGKAVTNVLSSKATSSGCQVVTTTSYPDNEHASALQLLLKLVPSPYPLNGSTFGWDSSSPAFLIGGDVTTGKQHDVVTARFVLVAHTQATGPTTGKATAMPIPSGAFAKVRLWQACIASIVAW
jgi:hypothetical protein